MAYENESFLRLGKIKVMVNKENLMFQKLNNYRQAITLHLSIIYAVDWA